MLAFLVFLLSHFFETASAQVLNPVTFFQDNCTACHTVGGGDLLGPDLEGIHKRVDSEWFVRFVMNPEALINEGDARALEIVQEFGGVVMPAVDMSRAQAEAIFLWLSWESSRLAIERGEPQDDPLVAESGATEFLPAPSQFGETANSTRELTPQDAAAGKSLFEGRQSLSNGGPACIACHNVSFLGGLGGGRLGPDLTGILERMGGRGGLEAWLRASPTETMRMVFGERPITPEEATSLVAYFKQPPIPEAGAAFYGTLQFLLFSVMGVSFLLLVIGSIWKGRLRGVRRILVESTKG